eukprot:3970536-Pyramimonas_sp.AAC.1
MEHAQRPPARPALGRSVGPPPSADSSGHPTCRRRLPVENGSGPGSGSAEAPRAGVGRGAACGGPPLHALRSLGGLAAGPPPDHL